MERSAVSSNGTSFTGLVLAGGRSSRMGRDKALLKTKEGSTLLERAVNLLRRVGAAEVLVSVADGKTYRVRNTVEISDQRAGCGPIGGLQAGLAASHCPLCLVLAVDLAAMTEPCLENLLSQASPECGVVPRRDGCFEPLAAVYPRTALVEVESSIQAEDYSLQHFVARLVEKGSVEVVEVSAGERALFANWNTPEDLAGEA